MFNINMTINVALDIYRHTYITFNFDVTVHCHLTALLISGPSVDICGQLYARHFTTVLRPYVEESHAMIPFFNCSIQTSITSKTKYHFKWSDHFQEVINTSVTIQ